MKPAAACSKQNDSEIQYVASENGRPDYNKDM